MAPVGMGNPNRDIMCNPGLISSLLSPTLFWVYDHVFKLHAQKMSRFKQKTLSTFSE